MLSCTLESLLVSYRPLALELSSSRARRNPLVLCLAGIREIRGLPGYAKYSRVFWKTRSRCRRAWKRCAPRAYVRIEASRRGDKEYYSATPKRGYKPRGNAPYLRCYHVEMNTESGSLLLDNEKRNQDYQRQYDAIGGV